MTASGHGTEQRRSASSPVASASRHFEYPPTSISLPPPRPGPRSASSGPSQPNRALRSSSAPSPPLSSTLHAHDFPLEEETTSTGYTFEITKHAGPASLKRIFIGPHTIGADRATKTTGTHRVGHDDSESEDSLGSDTSEEEDEGRRRRIRDKLARRTRKRGDRYASGSTVATGSGAKKVSMQKWTGGSFEIGGDIRAAAKRRKEASKKRAQTIRDLASSATATRNGQATSFVTANSHLDPPKSTRLSEGTKATLNGHYELELPPPKIENALPALTHDLLRRNSNPPIDTASINIPIDTPEITIDPVPHSNPKSILRTATVSALGKGYPANRATYLNGNAIPSGAKSVQLPISRQSSSPRSALSIRVESLTSKGDAPPVPASEVLARPSDKAGVLDESRGNSFEEALKRRPGRKTVLKKDRMLIRVEWTQRDDLPDLFNEESARKFPTRQEPWQEYAVVWRRHRLELWTEPAVALKSIVSSQKKLAHVIPLQSPRTKLSLYSSPDVIFCLTYRPDTRREEREKEKNQSKEPKAKSNHHFRKTGTEVYIMRPRSIKVAKEWMWDLYLELGGSIPSSLEISVPGLGARLHLPLPADKDLPSNVRDISRGGYQAEPDEQRKVQHSYSPKSVVGICKQYLSNVTDWKELFAQAEEEGLELRLAWRRGNVLDWVGTEIDCREWSVLGGIALCQPGNANTLELRPALHYPTTCRLPSPSPKEPSKRLSEPPGIEGYLTRLRPNGKAERIYLSSHDEHLFLCRPSNAHPPEPPIPVREGLNNPAAIVLAPFLLGFASLGKPKETERDHLWERISGIQSRKTSKRNDEIVSNLDSAEEIQSPLEAFEMEEKKRIYQQIIAARGFLDLVNVESIKMAMEEENTSAVEVDDIGGEEGLTATKDKELLRRHRSFVVRTKSGVDVRFECYSISVAKEWVGRLNALVTYWRRRTRIDAIEQMELHPSLRSTSAATPTNELDDLDNPTPLLSKIYNHCVMDGCRTILRQGRFYVRKGSRGIFQERLVFLLPGIVIEYQSKKRNIHGQALSTVYHQRKNSFSLRGVYVYSGILTANVLGPTGVQGWDPTEDRPSFPRMYTARDGLRTTDSEEDCTLVLFKRTNESKGLGKKGKITVMRARSKVERDEWLFALNAAIERLHRSEHEREERLKEFPWLEKST